MTVYVESNFVLEVALEQEEHDVCREIVGLARQRSLTLVVPAFSLVEPQVAVSGKEKVRSRLIMDIKAQGTDLARSRPNRSLSADLAPLIAVLAHSAEFEKNGVRDFVIELIQCAEVIPLDTEILRRALQVQADFAVSGQDAIVLASVFEHLEANRSAQSCFPNRNTKDFSDPSIRKRLEEQGCKFFGNFTEALGYLRSQQR
jgi:hypothetical protein